MKTKSKIILIFFWLSFLSNAGEVLANENSIINQDIFIYLKNRNCNKCNLKESDLVNLDLKNSNLRETNLENSNLSGSILDGSDLKGSNLSFSSFKGSSLRNVNLKEANLEGTDFRNADLTGALISVGGLSKSHWEFATGLKSEWLNYNDIYNAGINAYISRRYKDSEYLFNMALNKSRFEPKPWIARAASKYNQGKVIQALDDLRVASELCIGLNDLETNENIKTAQERILKEIEEKSKKKSSSGPNLNLIGSSLYLLRLFSPL